MKGLWYASAVTGVHANQRRVQAPRPNLSRDHSFLHLSLFILIPTCEISALILRISLFAEMLKWCQMTVGYRPMITNDLRSPFISHYPPHGYSAFHRSRGGGGSGIRGRWLLWGGGYRVFTWKQLFITFFFFPFINSSSSVCRLESRL